MINESGENVELYIPRKWCASLLLQYPPLPSLMAAAGGRRQAAAPTLRMKSFALSHHFSVL
jgi:hypothetical protein